MGLIITEKEFKSSDHSRFFKPVIICNSNLLEEVTMISINVEFYNHQPGIYINYLTGENRVLGE